MSVSSGQPNTGALALDDANPQILNELRKITSNSAQQVAEVGTIAYFVGLFISLGMNFAAGNGLGALFICWLSWINVGWVIYNGFNPGL